MGAEDEPRRCSGGRSPGRRRPGRRPGSWSLVPGLNADLTRDQAVPECEHGRAEDVRSIRVAARLGEGDAAAVTDSVLDAVCHVASAQILDPSLDLAPAAQDAR